MKKNERETRIDIFETCPSCNGNGIYTPPIWAEFNKWWIEQTEARRCLKNRSTIPQIKDDPHFADAPDPDDCAKWWSARGYKEVPEEEQNCRRCGGGGEITRRITLSELARRLGEKYGNSELAERLGQKYGNLVSPLQSKPDWWPKLSYLDQFFDAVESGRNCEKPDKSDKSGENSGE